MARKTREKPKFSPAVSWKVKTRPAFFSLLILLVVLIAHGASMWNGFVLDDRVNIKPFGLVSIEKRKWEPVWYELYTDAFEKPLSEPMRRLTLAFDYQSGHLDSPAVYHTTNVLLQAAGAIAAFFLLLRLSSLYRGKGEDYHWGLPLFVLALFCAHPLTSESVAYISGRSSLLCFLFYMLALNSFMTGFSDQRLSRQVSGMLGAYLLSIVALFTSAQAISIPLAMLLIALTLKPAGSSYREFLYERGFELAGVLVFAVALPAVALSTGQMPPPLFYIGLPTPAHSAYYLSSLKALSQYYLRATILPVGLSIYPSAFVTSLKDPSVWLSVASLIFSLYVVLVRRKPFTFLGLFLFVFGLLPHALLPTPLVAHGARFYLSLFGLILVFGEFVFDTGREFLKPDRKTLILAAVPVLILAALSNWRDASYKNNHSLIGGAIRLDKTDRALKALLAFKMSQEGGEEATRGAELANEVVRQDKDMVLAQLALANYAQTRQNYPDAAKRFAVALDLAEKQRLDEWIIAYSQGGVARSIVVMESIDSLKNARIIREYAEHALKFDPTIARLYLAKGMAMLAENKAESAELACREFDKGRRFDLNDPAFAFPVAQAALKTGYPQRMEQAFGAAKLAYRLNPQNDARLLLARASLESGRIHKGFAILGEYVSIVHKPDAESLIILSGLERQSGRKELADIYLAAAKKLNPDIERDGHIFLTVKPKPSREKENVGPDSLDPKKVKL